MQEVVGSIPFASTPHQGFRTEKMAGSHSRWSLRCSRAVQSAPDADQAAWCRRGAGEGGVYQETLHRRLASGERVEYRLWAGVVETDRDPSTGQRRRVKVRAKTKAEAVAKMRAEQDRDQRQRCAARALTFHPPPAPDGSGGRVPHRLAALTAVMLHVGLRPGEGTGPAHTGWRWD